MSWRATAEIKELVGITRTEKLVLLMLADYHNERTGQCNPSISDIAADALLSERRTRQVLSALEKKGLLIIEGREGGRHTAQYWLACIGYTPETISPQGGKDFPPGGKFVPPRGEIVSPQGGNFVPTINKVEPQEEPGIEPIERGADVGGARPPKPLDAEFLAELAALFPGVDLAFEKEKFEDYCRARGRRYKDLRAAFRNWVRKAVEYERARQRLQQNRNALGRDNGSTTARVRELLRP